MDSARGHHVGSEPFVTRRNALERRADGYRAYVTSGAPLVTTRGESAMRARYGLAPRRVASSGLAAHERRDDLAQHAPSCRRRSRGGARIAGGAWMPCRRYRIEQRQASWSAGAHQHDARRTDLASSAEPIRRSGRLASVIGQRTTSSDRSRWTRRPLNAGTAGDAVAGCCLADRLSDGLRYCRRINLRFSFDRHGDDHSLRRPSIQHAAAACEKAYDMPSNQSAPTAR